MKEINIKDSAWSPTAGAQGWKGAVIDCDVHVNVPSLEALFPYQDIIWVEAARERGWKGPSTDAIYPSAANTTARNQWRVTGKVPASELWMLQEHLLDPMGTEAAIITCYYGIESMRHPDWAGALAASVNDWLIQNWLEKDARLRASMVIPSGNPIAAAKEIDRVGGHPGFVQVLLPVRTDGLMGQRMNWPIFEAMCRHDLIGGIHRGGIAAGAPSPTGWASYHSEEMAAEVQVYASQLTSLIIEGSFQKFPGLRISVLEGGFTWVPTWAWNLNKKWKGLRREFPWVNRLPTDILRDHFRFSIAPIDMGPSEHMRMVLDWLGTDELLMYASDYPHMHNDEIGKFLSCLSDRGKARVMSENAREWYRL